MVKEQDKILEGEILEPTETIDGLEDEFGEEYKNPFEDADANAASNAKKVSDGFWRTVAKASKHIPQIENIVAAYYCAFDPDTSNRVRAILLASLAYFVLPLDAIPDFLAGFGFTDDIAVLTAALSTVQSAIKERHVDAAKRKLAQNEEISD